jgi:hypothetical protein
VSRTTDISITCTVNPMSRRDMYHLMLMTGMTALDSIRVFHGPRSLPAMQSIIDRATSGDEDARNVLRRMVAKPRRPR